MVEEKCIEESCVNKQPSPNGKLSLELPSQDKKDIEVFYKNKKIIHKSTDEYHGTDCGCGSFRPNWLQRFRSPKMFLLNFSLLGVLRAAYFTYMISCLSTIEKRYAFPSRISAIILICDNISGLLLNPVVGYLGTRVNGPKLIGIGCIIVSFSSMLSGLPYFIYGPSSKLLASSTFDNSNSLFNTISNDTNPGSTKFDYCDMSSEDCVNDPESFNFGAFLIFAGASFLNGFGYTSFWTIGLPYLDDNTKKGKSPIYISISTVIRMFGVSVGYFISSFCLSLYEDPSLKPNIKTNDPRWVGAWWIGFFVIGICFLIFSIPLFFFPPSMKKPRKKAKGSQNLSFRDALTVLNRLVRNPILVFDAIGGSFRTIGFAGYWINKPRYIEAQYSQSASRSSFLTGATSIVMKSIGILAGGIFMAKFKPNPKILVLMIICVELICNSFFFSAMFFGCESPSFSHISYESKSLVDLECNRNCQCTQKTFQPICASDGRTNYFSPCFAGCLEKNTIFINKTKTTKFENCGCDGETMTSGICKLPPEEQCNNLATYLVLMSLAGIISSFARTPNVMIAMRSVNKEDKSFAFGIIGSFFSIFAYIPYPIIFGFVTDAACIMWEKTCGQNGNCWLYDLDKLRIYMHSTAFTFMMIGTFFDVCIYFFADRLKNLYDEEDDEDDEDEPPRKIIKGDTSKIEMNIYQNQLEEACNKKENVK